LTDQQFRVHFQKPEATLVSYHAPLGVARCPASVLGKRVACLRFAIAEARFAKVLQFFPKSLFRTNCFVAFACGNIQYI